MKTIKRLMEDIVKKIKKTKQQKALEELTRLSQEYDLYKELEKDDWG